MARKILLADDSVTAQNMGRKILADAGYEVYTVNNGSAALKKVAEARPDVIVLDVYMPGYSGLEVCLRLKESSDTARIPILLTVGKLEPFKPEEAKRARADAFIVKPFEASELLSALSKLEDKIVPRPEPAKPGRFARAIAAVEEGRYDKDDVRYDKSMPAEEDSGWKERISFPSKKKKKSAAPEPEEGDDPAVRHAANKDLRTVVEPKPGPTPPAASPDDTRVDLAALAFQGLPQDVTPQEIAALAAAAARIQDTMGAKPGTESRVPEERSAEVPPPESQTEPPPQPQIVAPQEAKAEDKAKAEPTEVAARTSKEEETSKEVAASIPVVEAAEQKAEGKEKIEESAEKPSEAVLPPEAPRFTPSISPDLTGAIAAMPLGTYVTLPAGNGSSSAAPEPEPVTMAAAAGAESAAGPSRWTAVPVALLPEEAALSLEQEMQKAHAAFAAAEAAHAAPAPPLPQTAVALVEPAPATEISAPVAAASEEPVVPFSAPPVPDLAQTMGTVASKAKDAIRAAVKEFETVAEALVGEKSPAPAEPEPVPVQPVEAVAQPGAEAPPTVEAKAEPVPVAEEKVPEPVPAISQAEAHPVSQQPQAQAKQEEQAETVAAAPEVPASAEKPETPMPVAASEVPAEPGSATSVSPQITEAAASVEQPEGGSDVMAKKEKEVAASTAAAWASWRRIRETGDGKGTSPEPSAKENEEAAAKGEAAMAVAAGAEKAPEEAPAEGESEEIASIVDSVLADMRPKIVQEISKKLKKKK